LKWLKTFLYIHQLE